MICFFFLFFFVLVLKLLLGEIWPQIQLSFLAIRSMEVGVTVEAEDLGTGQRKVTNTSFFKFVSMGKDLKTLPVRPMALETREDVQHFLDGKKRYENKGSKKNQ